MADLLAARQFVISLYGVDAPVVQGVVGHLGALCTFKFMPCRAVRKRKFMPARAPLAVDICIDLHGGKSCICVCPERKPEVGSPRGNVYHVSHALAVAHAGNVYKSYFGNGFRVERQHLLLARYNAVYPNQHAALAADSRHAACSFVHPNARQREFLQNAVAVKRSLPLLLRRVKGLPVNLVHHPRRLHHRFAELRALFFTLGEDTACAECQRN